MLTKITPSSKQNINNAIVQLSSEGLSVFKLPEMALKALASAGRQRVAIVVDEWGGNSKMEELRRELEAQKIQVRGWTRGSLPGVFICELIRVPEAGKIELEG